MSDFNTFSTMHPLHEFDGVNLGDIHQHSVDRFQAHVGIQRGSRFSAQSDIPAANLNSGRKMGRNTASVTGIF